MNIPGFTAESSISANSTYRLAAKHDWGEQTVRAQVNCLGCTGYATEVCDGLPPHLLAVCHQFYYNRCCHGIID